MDILNNILYDTVYHSVPIILGVLGGIFAYKANVLNIGLEGMMLMGAFSSALFVYLTGSLFIGILISILCTLILGYIFSFFSITLKSNFIITGFGINLFVAALSSFVLQFMKVANINVSKMVDVISLKIQIPLIKDIPLLNNLLSGHTAITYLSLLLIFVVYVVMYKTRFGVYVRVVGESEEAAKSVGININRIRYAAVIIGAVLCALAGANLSVERMALFTNNMTAGRGFIAIAAIYCGKGKPIRSTLYTIVFGLAQSLAINLRIYAGPISGLFDIIPYIMMIAVLFAVSSVQILHTRTRGFKNE